MENMNSSVVKASAVFGPKVYAGSISVQLLIEVIFSFFLVAK